MKGYEFFIAKIELLKNKMKNKKQKNKKYMRG
jgi:hypothetical protein